MASPTIASFTLLDGNGVKASTRAYMTYNGTLETVDALIGNWLQLGGDIDDVTNAQIVGGSILIPLTPDAGWKAAPVAVNDVSDVVVLNMKNAATRYLQEFIIPAFIPALLTGGGQVDLANVALTALVTLLATSFTNGAYSNMAGQDITALSDAFQSDRKHRRQIISRSKVYS